MAELESQAVPTALLLSCVILHIFIIAFDIISSKENPKNKVGASQKPLKNNSFWLFLPSARSIRSINTAPI